MTLTVQWVEYGVDATRALGAAIAKAKSADVLSPLTVLVPSNQVGVVARRLLALGAVEPAQKPRAGLISVSFLTPYRLAELLGAAAAASTGRRPVSTPVIAAAIRRALREQPGTFAAVADHESTELAMVSSYRELRDLSSVALGLLSRTSDRGHDVIRIHRAARERLVAEWYDEEDLVDSAIETARADLRRIHEMGPFVLYLPQLLSRNAARLVKELATHSEVLVLAGTTGNHRADADVVTSVERIVEGGGGGVRESNELAAVCEDRTRIVTVSDSEEEVRLAMRIVVDEARAGTPLDRIAVLYGSDVPYGRLVTEHFRAAGIPYNGVAPTPLTTCLAGRTLLGLLSLPAAGFRRDDVFAWLAGAGLCQDGRPLPVASWERVSRSSGIVRGRRDWDRRLATFARDADLRAGYAASDTDAIPGQANAYRDDAAAARSLRTFVLELIDDLTDAAATLSSWRARSEWARLRLGTLLEEEDGRDQWPPHERKEADQVFDALRRLGSLDAIDGHADLATFGRTLELELESRRRRTGRVGEGVVAGSLDLAIGLDLELVIVLGLAEGLLPASANDDSLLPDHERRSAKGELPLRGDAIERQHRHLLAVLACANRHVLCVPRGDLRGNGDRVPSRWVLEIASALFGIRVWSEDLFKIRRPWLTHESSFEAALRDRRSPATEQEHRLRTLIGLSPGELRRLAARSGVDPIVAAGSTMVFARRSRHFTRFDGQVGRLGVPSPTDRLTSATALERWAACPFAYLLGDVLRVEPIRNPEDDMQISAQDRGLLIHEVLDTFIAEVLTRSSADQPKPEQQWAPSDRARIFRIAQEAFARYEERGLAGHAILWEREKRKILVDLEIFLERDSENRAAQRTRLLATELAFGLPGSTVDAAALELPDGRILRFRGRIDRVDISEDGTLHVVDYKTGRNTKYRGLGVGDPTLGGRTLQLGVYGHAARSLRPDPSVPVRSEYWFASSRGGFARLGFELTPAIVQQVRHTLGSIVAGVEEGVFPANPSPPSAQPWVDCPYCDPDGLGTMELRKQAERKREDPSLVAVLALAERDDAENGSERAVTSNA